MFTPRGKTTSRERSSIFKSQSCPRGRPRAPAGASEPDSRAPVGTACVVCGRSHRFSPWPGRGLGCRPGAAQSGGFETRARFARIGWHAFARAGFIFFLARESVSNVPSRQSQQMKKGGFQRGNQHSAAAHAARWGERVVSDAGAPAPAPRAPYPPPSGSLIAPPPHKRSRDCCCSCSR